MKSIEMTKEAWDGITADKDAFTIDDEKKWIESKDIQCLPAIVATLRGLRKEITVTAIAIKDMDGEAITAATELSVAKRESLKVKIEFTPAAGLYDCTFASGDATKVKVTKLDECTALIEPVAAHTSAITITATAATGVTGTCTIKPVA